MFSGFKSLLPSATPLLIRWQDIPVNNIEPVQMLESHQQLCGIIPRPDLVEFSLPLQMMKQLSTIDERQYEVELFSRLEREFKGDNKWTIDFGEDSPFGQSVGDFGSRDDVGFSNRLEGVDP
jgi:hypothetical protein